MQLLSASSLLLILPRVSKVDIFQSEIMLQQHFHGSRYYQPAHLPNFFPQFHPLLPASFSVINTINTTLLHRYCYSHLTSLVVFFLLFLLLAPLASPSPATSALALSLNLWPSKRTYSFPSHFIFPGIHSQIHPSVESSSMASPHPSLMPPQTTPSTSTPVLPSLAHEEMQHCVPL